MVRQPIVPDMPSLLPDELLYSLLGRLLLLNPFERPQASLRELIGGRLATVSVDLTTRLGELHARLGELSPCRTPQDLAVRATLFPYHRAFLPADRGRQLLDAQLWTPSSWLRSAAGLAANGFGAAAGLRYCPQCVREDHHQHGTGYWHRSHQLPGVLACPKHGIALVHFLTPAHSGNRHALVLTPWRMSELERGPAVSREQLRFARLSAQALHQTPSAATEEHRAAVYQRAAIDLGFAGARARIDHEQLAQALLDHHHRFDGFEHRERLLATSRTPLAWLRPLLGRPQRASHPICHLVLIDFLFGSWAAYEAALHAAPPVQAAPLCAPVDSARDEGAVVIDAVLDSSTSCREAARRTGLCVTTIATRRRAAGLAVASRPKSVCGPLVNRVRRLLLDGLSPAQVAERTGVSMTTAYRIRRVHAQALAEQRAEAQRRVSETQRDLWLSLAAEKQSVKDARRRQPACYAWLYRHDRDWLCEANAGFAKGKRSSPRIDWSARDRVWADRLKAYARTWRERHPRAWLSCSHLRRVVAAWALRRCTSKLPQTTRMVTVLAESRADFQRRRVVEAERSLQAADLPTVTWRVLAHAGLRRLPLSSNNPSPLPHQVASNDADPVRTNSP